VEVLLAGGLLVCNVKESRPMAKKTFEQSMKQLEQIVVELESGN